MDPVFILQQLINGISRGSVYALIALGYTMVYGIIELINFAHGDVFMLGSFTAISVVALFGVNDANPVLQDPLMVILALLVTFVITMVLMGLLGVLVEQVAYRPLRNAPKLAPLISAIGVSYILQNVGQIWRGPAPVNFPDIFQDTFYHIPIGTQALTIRSKAILILVVAIVLMVLLTLFVQRTKMGKAMRATALDRETAQLMGINVNMTIALTFFIGAALAGAGGLLYGMFIRAVQFTLGYQAGLRAFTAAVLGGIGNIPGAMLGGFLIGILEAMSDTFFQPQWTQAVVFAVLILILVFRPSGLLGQHVPEKV
ncbi:MAG TPA: branched-chain amino acid ABC transporter permease [Chloroflexia bacterium]|nr:branched-chain amino acid ABC transporter permease [Chloroflexia bacterium]